MDGASFFRGATTSSFPPLHAQVRVIQASDLLLMHTETTQPSIFGELIWPRAASVRLLNQVLTTVSHAVMYTNLMTTWSAEATLDARLIPYHNTLR